MEPFEEKNHFFSLAIEKIKIKSINQSRILFLHPSKRYRIYKKYTTRNEDDECQEATTHQEPKQNNNNNKTLNLEVLLLRN